jgi:hypothetical protein
VREAALITVIDDYAHHPTEIRDAGVRLAALPRKACGQSAATYLFANWHCCPGSPRLSGSDHVLVMEVFGRASLSARIFPQPGQEQMDHSSSSLPDADDANYLLKTCSLGGGLSSHRREMLIDQFSRPESSSKGDPYKAGRSLSVKEPMTSTGSQPRPLLGIACI